VDVHIFRLKGVFVVKKPLPQTWNLETFFQGGSSSESFRSFLNGLEADVRSFREALSGAKAPQSAADQGVLVTLTELLQQIQMKIHEAYAFTECLMAENQHDKKATLLFDRVKTTYAEYQSSLTHFDQLLKETPDTVWQAIVAEEPLHSVEFALTERRELAKEKLSPEMESLINSLSVDGYSGWESLYDVTVAKFKMTVEEDGKQVDLSAGQGFNRLHTPDNAERARLMQLWEDAWAANADYSAEALNRLAGFRLKVYDHRGWGDVHKEPLSINRMSGETLRVMWDVIDRNKDIFVEFMDRKAKLMGLEKLAWVDVAAPLGNSSRHIAYDEGADIIVEQFGKFSPRMAAFAAKALEEGWIEAEDRAGKRPGGFCTSFPIKHQTRIFMTYSGTSDNVSTLAHELGHAYHQDVMEGLPPLTHNYAMNVAETASTFAEMIVKDALVKNAANDEERIALLAEKVGDAVTFFMNIHCRFIFETNFYAERRKGMVPVERLNELMVDAQKQAFKDSLSDYHPHFWAAKLHFYNTGVPFYNFPYTFGYLFSYGIYARAVKEGLAFENKYAALLRDTGSMTVEDLAQKHLGVDLTKPEFWQSAVDMAVSDARLFLELTANK